MNIKRKSKQFEIEINSVLRSTEEKKRERVNRIWHRMEQANRFEIVNILKDSGERITNNNAVSKIQEWLVDNATFTKKGVFFKDRNGKIKNVRKLYPY